MKKTRQQILNRASEVLGSCYGLVPDLASDLERVHFAVSARMTRAAGNARPRTGEIRISLPYFEDPENFDSALDNVITHEIAHILSPPTRSPGSRKFVSHGAAWKAMHRRLGGSGDRCHTLDLAVGYERKAQRRAPRTGVECPCGCGETMHLGPTQLKRHKAGLRDGVGPQYFLRGHRPRRPGV
jgi:predicted SprT family Zn-dependent metalloprotease